MLWEDHTAMEENRMNNISEQEEKKKIALKKIFLFLLIVGTGAIVFGTYWLFYGRTVEETDDAYVNGSQNVITSQVGGTVKELFVNDTQHIEKGELIASIDDTDYKIALENAAASLGKAVRAYSGLSSQVEQLKDEVVSRENQLKKAETDFAMDRASFNAGLVSRHQYLIAKNNLNIASAALEQSRKALKNAQVQAESNSVISHPDVQQAVAAYKKAYVNLMRTKIYSPVTGTAAKKAIFLGQEIAPSQELLTVIDLENIWADVNLKETQMKDIKVGNKAILTSDINGKKYTGYVQGISAGTGSSLALLPAQNATGNWIKIVQRVPVRIHIDAESIRENGIIPIGSSMKAVIHTDERIDATIPFEEKSSSLYTIDEALMKQEIDKIIQVNLGKE